jgi:hypothetical protein
MGRPRRGRPPLSDGEPSESVHIRLPASLYDRAFAAASQDRISIPELIRRAVQRELQQASPSHSAT